MNLFIILFVTFVFMVLFVGGYVYMFLHIMRNDPREIEFRKNSDEDSSLVPHKYEDEKRKSAKQDND